MLAYPMPNIKVSFAHLEVAVLRSDKRAVGELGRAVYARKGHEREVSQITSAAPVFKEGIVALLREGGTCCKSTRVQ